MAAEDYDPGAEGWGLVVPFIACQSQGGAYDDEGFCAGFQVGMVDGKLAAMPASYEAPFYAPLVPLLDLIAMKHDYLMKSTATEHDLWAWCTFTRRGMHVSDGTSDESD